MKQPELPIRDSIDPLVAEKAGKRRLLIALASGFVAIAVLVGATAAYFQRREANAPAAVETSSSPTPSPSGGSVVSPESPSPSVSASPTASASPTPSTSPSASTPLPDSVKAAIANFYGAYSAQDLARLRASFVADANDEQKELSSTLFTGQEPDGTPGGPMLFASNITGETVVSHQVSSWSFAGDKWTVTVAEQRSAESGTATRAATALLTFSAAPSGAGTWLLDSYTRSGSTGKYNGFFTQ